MRLVGIILRLGAVKGLHRCLTAIVLGVAVPAKAPLLSLASINLAIVMVMISKVSWRSLLSISFLLVVIPLTTATAAMPSFNDVKDTIRLQVDKMFSDAEIQPETVKVAETMGTVVPRPKAANWYSLFGDALRQLNAPLLARIQKVQAEEALKRGYPTVPLLKLETSIVLVDSAQQEFRIFQTTKNSTLFIQVIVPTKILRLYTDTALASGDLEKIRQANLQLIALISRELAKAVNPADGTKQATSIRANSEAIGLMKDAGIAPENLYYALENSAASVLESNQQDSKSTIAVSGRPDANLELSLTRVALTMGRLEFGEKAINYKISMNPKKLQSELQSFQFPNPTDGALSSANLPRIERLEDALTLLESLPQRNQELSVLMNKYRSVNGYDLDRIETFEDAWNKHTMMFNHAYFSMIKLLDKANFSSDTISRVIAIHKQILLAYRNPEILFPRLKDLNSKERQIEGATTLQGWSGKWLSILHPNPGDDFAKSKFLANGAYIDLLAKEILTSLTPDRIATDAPLLTLMLKSDAYYERFRGEIILGLQNGSPRDWIAVMRVLDIRSRMNLQATFYNTVFSRLSLAEKTSLLQREGSILWESVNSDLGESADRREIAVALWRDRGLFALADDWGFEPQEAIKWRKLVQTLGVSEKIAYPQVAESVREYTRTKEYASVLLPLPSYQNIQISNDTVHRRQPWAEADLFYYIRGDYNRFTQGADAHAQLENRKKPELSFLIRNPKILGSLLLKNMIERINSRSSVNEPFNFKLEGHEILNQIAGTATTLREGRDNPFFQTPAAKYLWAWAIKKSRLSPQQQTIWLKSFSVETAWLASANADKTLKRLQQQSVIDRASDLAIVNPAFKPGYRSDKNVGDINLIKDLQPSFLKELKEATQPTKNEAARSEKFISSIRRILSLPYGSSEERAKIHSQALETLATFNFSLEKRITLFKRIMKFRQTATIEGDAYFRKFLAQDIQKKILKEGLVPEIISRDYVLSSDIRAWLVSSYVDQLATSAVSSSEQLEELTKKITQFVPELGSARDEILEKIAWKFSIDNFEDLKKMNTLTSREAWRQQTPLKVDLASQLSRYVDRFSPSEISSLINYLLKSNRGAMPQDLKASFKAVIAKDTPNARDEHLNAAVTLLEANASKLNGEERLTYFDLLFQTGKSPLIKEDNFQDKVIREYLHIEPSTEKGRWILAYLSAVPRHEQSVTLAYLMARQTDGVDGGLSMRDIFEVFQTVGKKAAQAADTWKLANEESRKSLREVKDNARPLSKFEILQTLKSELPPAQYASIAAIEARLGAASIKTVVRVRLKNGKRLAIAVMGKNALAQVQTNSDFGVRFMDALGKQGLLKTGRIEAELIVRLKKQTIDELDMRTEAKKINTAQKILASAANNLSIDMRGWKLIIPSVATEIATTQLVLPMALAQGVTIDKIQDTTLRKEVGHVLVATYLRAFFASGWLDADRHIGNQLIFIEPGSKEIHILDFGQSFNFKVSRNPLMSDDRTKIAELLRYIDASNVDGIYKTMKKISDEPGLEKNLKQNVKEQVAKVLVQRNSNPDFMLDLVKIFIDANMVPADRFFTGFFKGFVTLIGEGYVSQSDFSDILKTEIKNHYGTKPIAAAKVGLEKILKGSVGTQGSTLRCEHIFTRQH